MLVSFKVKVFVRTPIKKWKERLFALLNAEIAIEEGKMVVEINQSD